jgi:hypothetical protein
MNRILWIKVVRAFRRTAVPLASYYAVTLALPLANGATQSGTAFAEHALVVLVVPPLLIVLACAVHTIGNLAARTLCPGFMRISRGPIGGSRHAGLRFAPRKNTRSRPTTDSS